METTLRQCVEWDVVNWSKALAFWESRIDLTGKGFRCLELGSRRGGLSLWLALKGNEVVCSDYKNPEDQASAIHQNYQYGGSITYEGIDATNIPYENSFDIVVFKSILGGIARDEKGYLKQVVVDQIFKALKPGGSVLFAENLLASSIHQLLRAKLTQWGGYWNYLSVSEVDELFGAYGSLEYRTAGFLGSFGRNEFQRNFLGKIDTWVFDWIATDAMKYIVYGLATKVSH